MKGKATMYRFNEERVFVDSVDGELVALQVETGAYFTFNEAATAVINDLAAGHDEAEIAAALEAIAGSDAPATLDAFLADIVDKGIMERFDGTAAPGLAAPSCSDITLNGGTLELLVDGYDDVAAYFMIDPIHEVDPNKGWPIPPQE